VATTTHRLQRAAHVTQRACRWLLQTRDRVEHDLFALKQEFLAVMLGVQRPTSPLSCVRYDAKA